MIPIWKARGRVCWITMLLRRFAGSSLGVTLSPRPLPDYPEVQVPAPGGKLHSAQRLLAGLLQCAMRAMQTFRITVNNPAESPQRVPTALKTKTNTCPGSQGPA